MQEREQEQELKLVQNLVQTRGIEQHSLVPILLGIQDEFGYLPMHVLEEIPKLTKISAGSIKSVISFYSHFRMKPAGKHQINVCIGTACYVKGAEQTYQAFLKTLDVQDGEDTDPDLEYTVSKVACLGCCMLAPAVQIGDYIFGWVDPPEIGRVLNDFVRESATGNKLIISEQVTSPNGEVKICLCSSCAAAGSRKIYNELLTWSQRMGFPLKTTLSGCTGVSFAAPLIKLTDKTGQSYYYGNLNTDNLQTILLKHFSGGSLNQTIDKLLYFGQNSLEKKFIDKQEEANDIWLTSSNRIVMESCTENSPCDYQIYKETGGFVGLENARKIGAQGIIQQISDSGLRGRGGGGYRTGLKMEKAATAASERKFVICNADEGDPGAFMDRMLLESVPFRVIEGMIIAALAVGANEGFIFVRREYPLAIERMKEAISLCQKENILKTNVENDGFCIHIVEGAGAFVCGEETALIAAIEGHRGIPRQRPPFPTEKGLFGYPSLINNVETLACIPWILRKGADMFKEIGTEGSPGTKTFALAGKVKKGGLIEVPMGITIRKVIEEYGGGVSGNAKVKAVQIGGPSGGCLPESLFDLPIDFEALSQSGAIMGSGGLVVLDEHDCMVDIARYFLEFTADESCGDCSFCRIGTKKALEMLQNLCAGKARKGDIERLEELCLLIKSGSKCGLGKTAPNPVLTTLKYFRDEYESHLNNFCPAGKCPDLFNFVVNDECTGCMLCSKACPVDAILFEPLQDAVIDNEKCVRCGTCRSVCPDNAIEVEPKHAVIEPKHTVAEAKNTKLEPKNTKVENRK